MKYLCLGLHATTLQISFASGAVRRDLQQKNVIVAEIDDTAIIDENAQEIVFPTPGSDFEDTFRCSKTSGKQLTFSADKKFVACCAESQKLVGSPDTAFDCCGGGHDLAGSAETGYRCCPTGQIYDGKVCKVPVKPVVCENGKALVDGKCVCPAGKVENANGGCEKPEECDSGLVSGKCYLFKMEDGNLLGYDSAGWYNTAPDSYLHHMGKFKLCKDEECKAGESVDPGDALRILDTYGIANGGTNANQWLNNNKNGAHVGKTADYNTAGVFTITKWTCGKYCLGGFYDGVGPTCPSTSPSLTFYTLDKQSCLPAELIEVPCDVHDNKNNCIWEKEPGSCSPGDSAHCKCSSN